MLLIVPQATTAAAAGDGSDAGSIDAEANALRLANSVAVGPALVVRCGILARIIALVGHAYAVSCANNYLL